MSQKMIFLILAKLLIHSSVSGSFEKKVSTQNLVMAGGCAMNGLVNGKIFKESNFKNHFIQPPQQMMEQL